MWGHLWRHWERLVFPGPDSKPWPVESEIRDLYWNFKSQVLSVVARLLCIRCFFVVRGRMHAGSDRCFFVNFRWKILGFLGKKPRLGHVGVLSHLVVNTMCSWLNILKLSKTRINLFLAKPATHEIVWSYVSVETVRCFMFWISWVQISSRRRAALTEVPCDFCRSPRPLLYKCFSFRPIIRCYIILSFWRRL